MTKEEAKELKPGDLLDYTWHSPSEPGYLTASFEFVALTLSTVKVRLLTEIEEYKSPAGYTVKPHKIGTTLAFYPEKLSRAVRIDDIESNLDLLMEKLKKK